MSENREQILESIKVQGEVVRKLKAAKEPKQKVCFDKFCFKFIDFFNKNVYLRDRTNCFT